MTTKKTPAPETGADADAPELAPAAAGTSLVEQLTAAIVGATNASGPIKQIAITKYKGKTPWNPTGARESKRPKFSREYWQNGAMVHRWQVTDADVALLNRLQPGRYMDRRVEVIARQADEGNVDATAIEIRYNNKTSDQRFENKNWFVNFSQLLRKLVTEIEQGADAAREVA